MTLGAKEVIELIGMEEGQRMLENAVRFAGTQTEEQLWKLWKEIAQMRLDGILAEAVLQGKLAAYWNKEKNELQFKCADSDAAKIPYIEYN